MIQDLVHYIITFIDLSALITLVGAVWCRLWMVQLTCEGTVCPILFFNRLRRLLMICMVAIVISSIVNLAQRTVEMSGAGVMAILPNLPTVMFKTHYGSMWFLRIAGLSAAWIVWWTGRRHMGSRFISALMLCAGAVVAFARSASGHSADFGDLSPQQIADWSHLLIASSWGGAVVALASIIPSSIESEDSVLQRFIAGIADRFYAVFGPALTVLVLTGIYSAWVEVGSFRALLTTPYGRVLSTKLVFFLLLTFRYIAPPQHGQDDSVFALKFFRRMRVEAIAVFGVLLCVSLLTHNIPARHASHLEHAQAAGGHEAHKQGAVTGPEPVVVIETTPTKITAGIPVTMTVRIKNPDGRPFEGLAISHERMLHAIIIGKDLNVFAHIHPEDIGRVNDEMLKTATFPLLFTFPKSGEYLIGIDYSTTDESYSKMFSINVAGEPEMGEPKIDFTKKKNFGEYRVTLTISPEKVKAGKKTTLRYVIEKDGKAVTNLEPYLGAAMHLAVVSSDLKLFIHAHGVTPGEPSLDHMHAAPPERFGPEILADSVFPVKGIYKVFSQVKHQGNVLLFDFMVDVQ